MTGPCRPCPGLSPAPQSKLNPSHPTPPPRRPHVRRPRHRARPRDRGHADGAHPLQPCRRLPPRRHAQAGAEAAVQREALLRGGCGGAGRRLRGGGAGCLRRARRKACDAGARAPLVPSLLTCPPPRPPHPPHPHPLARRWSTSLRPSDLAPGRRAPPPPPRAPRGQAAEGAPRARDPAAPETQRRGRRARVCAQIVSQATPGPGPPAHGPGRRPPPPSAAVEPHRAPRAPFPPLPSRAGAPPARSPGPPA
jgi:hypothetical protein